MGNQGGLSRSQKLVLAGVVLATLTLAWNIGKDLMERPSEQLVVLLSDSSKRPRTDVAVVGPKGQTLYPESRGMLLVPRSWAGKSLHVYERSTWQELTTIRLQDLGDEPQQRTISQ